MEWVVFLTWDHKVPGLISTGSAGHCTEFIILLLSSRYGLNNVERDVKYKIIIKE